MKKRNKIISIILSGTFALAAIGLGVGIGLKKPDKNPTADIVMPKEDIVSDNEGNKMNDGVFHNLPIAMLVSQTPTKTETSDDMKTSVNVVATITPDDAANKAVDWTVAFVNASSNWASGKTATDYITAEPTTDGALTATVTCKAAFGEQIKITVTSRDNSDASASCTVDYKQQFTGYIVKLSQEGKNPVTNTDTKRGMLYADFETDSPLSVQCAARKSLVYTVALDDSEITMPTKLQVSYGTQIAKKMNEIKENSGEPFEIDIDGDTFSLNNLFNKNMINGYTAAQKNSFIETVTTAKTNAAVFRFKNGDKVLTSFTFNLDVSALTGQKSVEKIVLDQTELVFGGNN